MGEGVNDTSHAGPLALYVAGHEAEGCSFSCFGSLERTWTLSGLLLPGPLPPQPTPLSAPFLRKLYDTWNSIVLAPKSQVSKALEGTDLLVNLNCSVHWFPWYVVS